MALESKLLTRLEPTIQLDKYKFKAFREEEGGSNVSRDKGMEFPLIIVNNYQFPREDIRSFEINVEDKIPTITVTVVDNRSQFAVETFPRDGDVMSIRIGSKSQETYKDIRIDFDIDNVESPLKNNVEIGAGGAKYTFTGKMKIPGLYAERCKSYGTGTTIDHLESIATDLKLGLATNVDVTNDSMNLFVPYDSMIDTIDDLVKHSYISDESFQTFCIDPYYYINYVDLNSILNTTNEFEDALMSTNIDLNDILPAKDETNNMETKLVLSSHETFEGSNMHIKRYALKNNSGRKVKSNGYKRTLQFFENDSENGLVSFDIEALTSTNLKDIEAPLKGRQDEERYKEEVKYKYVGRRDSDPDTSNTHLNYTFAALHNTQNLEELDKLQLEVELSSFNPAIHMFQKIPVMIFHRTQNTITADSVVKNAKKEKDFTTSETGGPTSEEPTTTGAIDEFLSGYYIVGKMRYTYKASEGIVKQHLTLLRREWPGRVNNMG